MEEQGNRQPQAALGIYRHEGAGKQLVALEVPLADAFIKAGFKYVGPAPADTRGVDSGLERDPEGKQHKVTFAVDADPLDNERDRALAAEEADADEDNKKGKR